MNLVFETVDRNVKDMTRNLHEYAKATAPKDKKLSSLLANAAASAEAATKHIAERRGK